MTSVSYVEMLQYLKENFGLSESSVESALHRSGEDSLFLPMVLWQYNLLTLKQLDRVYDWLATECTRPVVSEAATTDSASQETMSSLKLTGAFC